MIFFSKISIVFFLVFNTLNVSGQTYEIPTPKMSKNVLKSYLKMHLEYPPEAILRKEEGDVRISFVVDEKGNLIRSNVSTSVSESIDSAALQLFSKILWNPAIISGQPKAIESEFKIKYNIKKYNSLVKKRGYDQLPEPFIPADPSLEIYTVKELNKAPIAILDSIYPSVRSYIANNLEFPEAASKLTIKGVVQLRFVIEPCGLPSNIMIIEAVGGGCTEEAIRIVQQLKWNPGIRQSLAVRTCYNMSIKFDPSENLKNKDIPNQSNSGM